VVVAVLDPVLVLVFVVLVVMMVDEAVWLVVLVMALLRVLLVVASVVGVVLTPVCEKADENAARIESSSDMIDDASLFTAAVSIVISG
jgi:hypothetical protein